MTEAGRAALSCPSRGHSVPVPGLPGARRCQAGGGGSGFAGRQVATVAWKPQARGRAGPGGTATSEGPRWAPPPSSWGPRLCLLASLVFPQFRRAALGFEPGTSRLPGSGHRGCRLSPRSRPPTTILLTPASPAAGIAGGFPRPAHFTDG
jgi:hypothetical protein